MKSNNFELELGPISIEWLETDPGPCAVCSGHVGWGPVGFRREQGEEREKPAGPVCDSCLLNLSPDLGMLLLFANAARELASDLPEDFLVADRQRIALMTFAKIYDLVAQWPRRPYAFMSFLKDLFRHILKRAAQVPLEAMIKMFEGRPN